MRLLLALPLVLICLFFDFTCSKRPGKTDSVLQASRDSLGPNVTVHDALNPRDGANLQITDIFPRQLIEYQPTADITHMWLTAIRDIWERVPELTSSHRFIDPFIRDSRIDFALTEGIVLSTQELAWACIFALNHLLLGPPTGQTTSAVPGAAIYTKQPFRRIGLMRPTITNVNANLTSKSAIQDSSSAQDRVPYPVTSGNNSSKTNVTLYRAVMNDSILDIDVFTTWIILSQVTILNLHRDVLLRQVWDRPVDERVSASFGPGAGFGWYRDGVEIFVTFMVLEQEGRSVTYGNMEQVIREVILCPAVRTFPQAFKAMAYLRDESGQRLLRPFLKIQVSRVSDFHDSNATIYPSFGLDRPTNMTY